MSSLIMVSQALVTGLSLVTSSCFFPQEIASEPRSSSPRTQAVELEDGEKLLGAEVSTVGWDRLSQTPVVLLRAESGQVVPIWVGLAEARAIMAALQDMQFSRPMTHDLMVNLLDRLDAKLEEVIVHDLKDGVYYGLLKLQVEGEDSPRFMDTRPSDGLALAVRTGAAVRLAQKILVDLPDYNFIPPEGEEQVVQAAGLTVVAVNEDLQREFSLPQRPGLVVLEATGQAMLQGLRRGDLIVEVNGVNLSQPMDFLDAVGATAAGKTIHVTYWRGGEERGVDLKLDAPDSPSKKKKGEQVV